MNTGPKFWAVGLLAGAFLTGAVLGGSVTAAWGDGEERDPRESRGSYSEALAEELDLSEAQQEDVAAILEASRPEMCSIWAELRPRYDTIRVGIREEIRGILTQAQIGAYEDMIAERDSVRAARSEERSGNRNGCED